MSRRTIAFAAVLAASCGGVVAALPAAATHTVGGLAQNATAKLSTPLTGPVNLCIDPDGDAGPGPETCVTQAVQGEASIGLQYVLASTTHLPDVIADAGTSAPCKTVSGSTGPGVLLSLSPTTLQRNSTWTVTLNGEPVEKFPAPDPGSNTAYAPKVHLSGC